MGTAVILCIWYSVTYIHRTVAMFRLEDCIEYMKRWMINNLMNLNNERTVLPISHNNVNQNQFCHKHQWLSYSTKPVVTEESGPRFNIKMTSYQYRKSHCGDKTILRPSYLHNGISYTAKMISIYWIRPCEFYLTSKVVPVYLKCINAWFITFTPTEEFLQQFHLRFKGLQTISATALPEQCCSGAIPWHKFDHITERPTLADS